MAEASLRPAAAQLENRQRRFATQLLTLPEGSEAKKVAGANSKLGERLLAAVRYAGGVERIEIPAKPSGLGAEVIVEEREAAKGVAEQEREGLTIFVDGSRVESAAVGYAVVWKKEGEWWASIKAHMGFSQEAFDAECAALERALEVATRRRQPPERVTIFSDAQAALARIASDEPGPGQQYALKAGKWVAQLRKTRPGAVSNCGGALHTKGWKETRGQTRRRSWQQKNQKGGGSSGWATRTAMEEEACRSQGP